MDTKTYAKNYADFYDNLNVTTSVDAYGIFFDTKSKFEDPFQKVQGIAAIRNIFLDMYKKMHHSQFIVDEVICSEDVAYIRWDFVFKLSENTETRKFTGTSRVTFNKQGIVESHIDYWDAAQHVYEHIPILGAIIRIIKSKMHA
jgi:hypothetical protein